MSTDTKKKPEKKFTLGNVVASVWKNESSGSGDAPRYFHSVSLQRSYLDDDGKRQYGNRFSIGDLATAIRALQLAMSYIESQEL